MQYATRNAHGKADFDLLQKSKHTNKKQIEKSHTDLPKSGRKITTPENRSSYFHPESKMGDVTLAGLLACGSIHNVLPSQEQN